MDTLHGASGRLSYFIASLNSSGTLEWATPISSPTYVGLTFDIAIGPDDGIYALGYFQNELAIGSTSISAASTKHGFVARFDTTGACTAAWHFGHAAFPTGSVLPTDHGVFVSSVYDSTMVFANMEVPAYQEGTPNFFVAKLDAIEGYTGTHSMVPLDSQLHIYANPNNGLCTIELPQGLPRRWLHTRKGRTRYNLTLDEDLYIFVCYGHVKFDFLGSSAKK